MKVGDLVQVVFSGLETDCKTVIYTGTLLIEQYKAYSCGRNGGPYHPYEILLSDGTILRDWSNLWNLEPWSGQ